jgi:hypothetical protein
MQDVELSMKEEANSYQEVPNKNDGKSGLLALPIFGLELRWYIF